MALGLGLGLGLGIGLGTVWWRGRVTCDHEETLVWPRWKPSSAEST